MLCMCVTHPVGSAGLVPVARGTGHETAEGDLASAPTAAAATAAGCPKGKLIINIHFDFNFSKHSLCHGTISRGG